MKNLKNDKVYPQQLKSLPLGRQSALSHTWRNEKYKKK